MRQSFTHRQRTARHLTFGLFLVHGAIVTGQVINDPLEEVGNESYAPGGFGSFNWVSAVDFGFANHAGAEGFLSAYSGPPLADIGMTKPLGGTMINTTYRVSFYMSKYFASGVPFSEFSELYIGSALEISVWDTVPTPTVDGAWVKWSGTFTPDAADLGLPFTFGFTMTLLSERSFALDGPLIIQDVVTGIAPTDGSQNGLAVWSAPGSPHVTVRCNVPIAEVVVYDAQGRAEPVDVRYESDVHLIETASLLPGYYSVHCLCTDGTRRVGRFVIVH